MKRITKKKLAKIIAAHEEWLTETDAIPLEDGVRGELVNVDLSNRDLSERNLERTTICANLRKATLFKTQFVRANLRGSDFTKADLGDAQFVEVDAEEVCFNRVEAGEACFAMAKLRNTRFIHANLVGASFHGADLSGACFSHACVDAADFRNAYLRDVSFHGASLGSAQGIIDAGYPNGYRTLGWLYKGQLQVRAGCRSMPIRDGRRYWGGKGHRLEIWAALDYIEAVAAAKAKTDKYWQTQENPLANRSKTG